MPALKLLVLPSLRMNAPGEPSNPDYPAAMVDESDRVTRDLGWLRSEVAGLLQRGAVPDLILLPGGVTGHGKRSEFTRAAMVLSGLRDLLRMPAATIVCVPGPSDINRAAAAAYFFQRQADELPPEEPYAPKLQAFAEFHASFADPRPTGAAPRPPFAAERPFGLRAFPEQRVVIAEMNSLYAADQHADADYPFLGPEQCDALAEALRPYQDQGYLRIGLCAHDLLRERPGLARAEEDRERFLSRLLPRLNLLLHAEPAASAAAVAAEGAPVFSLCCTEPDLAAAPLAFALLEFSAEAVSLSLRVRPADATGWQDAPSTANGPQRFPFAPAGVFTVAAPTEEEELARRALWLDGYRRERTASVRRPALYRLGVSDSDVDAESDRIDLLNLFVPQRVSQNDAGLLAPRRASGDILSILTSPTEPWVLVYGEPGSGKSALLRYLALRLCAPGESLPPLSSELVPVLIELRRLADHLRDAPMMDLAGLFGFLTSELRAPPEVLESLADRGQLVFLWDALDEVPDAEARRTCTRLIDEVRRRYPCRGVVTSRSHGFDPGPLFELPSYTLQGFDEAQTDVFLDRWFAAAFATAPAVGVERAARLRKARKESAALRTLCERPLLLQLVALLSRGGEVPKGRPQLYARVVALLVHDWEASKALPGGTFSADTRLRYLRELAWHMMEAVPGGSGNLIRDEELRAFSARFCMRDSGVSQTQAQADAGQLLHGLRERSGVLVPVGGGAYGFSHRGLLEYLAADAARSRYAGQRWSLRDVQRKFQERYRDRAWTEVLALFCALLEDDAPGDIVAALQAVLRTVPVLVDPDFLEYAAFAVRCLGMLNNLQQQRTCRFAETLTELLIARYSECDFLFGGGLRTAMRGVAGRWPGAPALRESMLSALRKDDTLRAVFVGRLALIASPHGTHRELIQSAGSAAQQEPMRVEFAEEISALTEPSRQEFTINHLSKALLFEMFNALVLHIDQGGLFPLNRWLILREDSGPAARAMSRFVRDHWDEFVAKISEPEMGVLYAAAIIDRGNDGFLKSYLPNLGIKIEQIDRLQNPELAISFFYEEEARWTDPDFASCLSGLLFGLVALWPNETPNIASENLLSALLDKEIPDGLRFMVSAIALRYSVSVSLREKGRRHLYDLLYKETETARGIRSATVLLSAGEERSNIEPALRNLLTVFNENFEHLFIACLLEDPSLLRNLSDTATDPIIRRRAASALEALRLRTALLSIGVPRRGEVRLDGRRAGVLEETRSGFRFTYDPAYLEAPDAEEVSLTLPLRREPYDREGLHPAFENLLAEGWLLDLNARTLKLDRRDSFGLLLATGKDCIGAIQVFPLAPEDDLP